MKRRAKYGNVKTVVDGFTFDSKKEARRYGELVLLLRAGRITDLELQVPFAIRVGDIHICDYVADFVYVENGKRVIEDVKSPATRKNPAYRIKAKLMAAYGNPITEV